MVWQYHAKQCPLERRYRLWMKNITINIHVEQSDYKNKPQKTQNWEDILKNRKTKCLPKDQRKSTAAKSINRGGAKIYRKDNLKRQDPKIRFQKSAECLIKCVKNRVK